MLLCMVFCAMMLLKLPQEHVKNDNQNIDFNDERAAMVGFVLLMLCWMLYIW